MDESAAIKEPESKGSGDLAATIDLRSRCEIVVEGYDTSLPVDVVESALMKPFSSCGEKVFVYIPYYTENRTLNRYATIYMLGDDAVVKAKAMAKQLSGSGIEGRKLVATSKSNDFIKLTPGMVARLARAERIGRSKMIVVSGYDTSLPVRVIKSKMTEHFSSCGEIMDFETFPEEEECRAPTTSRYACIWILGKGAEEKALELDGSDMGGFKLAVKAAYHPMNPRPGCSHEGPRGYTLPARITNPRRKIKKSKKNKKKKKTSSK